MSVNKEKHFHYIGKYQGFAYPILNKIKQGL